MKTASSLALRARPATSLMLRGGLCLGLLLGVNELAAQQNTSQESSLTAVRDFVKKNEDLAILIKMDYRVEYERTAKLPTTSGSSGRQRGPRPYSNSSGTWAQDAIKQYSAVDHFFDAEELARSFVRVIDGQVMKWAGKPDFMVGGIALIENFDWGIGPLYLGIKPFESSNQLSDVLVPEHAALHEKTEMVAGREAYVVTARTPPYDLASQFARMYIDCQRGTPLRLEHYYLHPDSSGAILLAKVDSIKSYKLPNGAWLPVEGVRELYFQKPELHVITERITVDVNSITTDRENIPDSLFTIKFPEGAKVGNAITGTTVAERLTDVIADESIEDLAALPDTEPRSAHPPSEAKAGAQDAYLRMQPHQANLPAVSKQETSVAPVPSAQTHGQRRRMLYLFSCALLAAFALVLIVRTARLRHRTTAGRPAK